MTNTFTSSLGTLEKAKGLLRTFKLQGLQDLETKIIKISLSDIKLDNNYNNTGKSYYIFNISISHENLSIVELYSYPETRVIVIDGKINKNIIKFLPVPKKSIRIMYSIQLPKEILWQEREEYGIWYSFDNDKGLLTIGLQKRE